jgi:hypothetical protein
MADLSIIIAHSARSHVKHGKHLLRLFPRCIESLLASVQVSGIKPELIVVDYPEHHDAGPPLSDWLPDELNHVVDVPLVVIPMAGQWDKGAALNAGVAEATTDVLFFLDADFLVVPEVLERGLGYALDGKVWCPGYLAQQADGKTFSTPPTMGYGNMFVPRRLWESYNGGKGWNSSRKHGCHDIPVGAWFAREGHMVEPGLARDPVPGFVHLWHPKYIGWAKPND